MSDQMGMILMCSNCLELCMINNVYVNDRLYNHLFVSYAFLSGPDSSQTQVCYLKSDPDCAESNYLRGHCLYFTSTATH